MKIPQHVIEEIRAKVRVEDIVSQYVSLTKRGDRLWGLSPFKQEKTASFSVSPNKGLWYCFSTQKGGDAVNFLMEVEHLSYVEALERIGKKLGIEVHAEEGLSEEYRYRKALLELNARLQGTFNHYLVNSEEGKRGLEYFSKRGIDRATIDLFRLGMVPSDPFWLHRFLVTKGYDDAFLSNSGLFSKKNPKWCLFTGRIMFPIRMVPDEVLGFGGRLLEGDGPKYLNSPETPVFHKGRQLFAYEMAREHIAKLDCSILCEGYMDAIALHISGVKNAVAPLGTALTREQIQLLMRHSKKIAFLFDNDDAGLRATLKNLVLAEEMEAECFIIELTGGKDPADIYLESGSHSLQKMVAYRLNAFEYLLSRSKNVAINSPGGKELVLQSFLPYLKSIQSEVRRGASIEMLADILSIPLETLTQELARRTRKEAFPTAERAKPVPEPPRSKTYEQLKITLDLRVLLAVFGNPELFVFLRSNIGLEDLEDPRARELFIVLEEAYRADDMRIQALLERVDDDALSEIVNKSLQDDEYGSSSKNIAEAGVVRIKERVLNHRRTTVEQALKRLSYQADRDPRTERELLEEKIVLDAALKELRLRPDDRSLE